MNITAMKEFILNKVSDEMKEYGDRLPVGTDDGKIKFTEKCGWVGGFWHGILNYCYLMSGNKEYLEYAEKSRYRFLDRIYKTPNSLDHDVGFLYIPSEYARYKIQHKEESLKVVIDAADSLMKRYNEKGRFIRAWDDWGGEFGKNNLGRIIIDCMYNLPLLFLASEKTGNKKYYDAAVAHADTCMDSIVRKDGTTYHTYVFDPTTGAKRFGETCQGWDNDSCWSRGQAWAIGGFAMAYRFTKDEKYLDVSLKCARKFIELNEPDYIPMWDFVFKGRNDMPRDASAAAIAADGMFELAEYCDDKEKKYFHDYAEKIVNALWEKCATRNNEVDGLINHCTGHYRAGGEVDQNLIFGDFYFVECVCKLLGIEIIL